MWTRARLMTVALTVALTALGGAVLVVADPRSGQEPGNGTALGESAIQSGAELGLTHVRVGDEVMFALPAFDNQSDRPLTVKSVRLVEVPDGFEVLDNRPQTYAETDGMMLTWSKRDSSLGGILAETRTGVDGLVIPAGSVGERYALVRVRVTSPPGGTIEDVDVLYEQDGRTYQQTLDAQWGVEMEGADDGVTGR